MVSWKMTSVERILQYSTLEQEAPARRDDSSVPSGWPINGAIRFDHIKLSYSKGGEAVLKDINISIQNGEKVRLLLKTLSGWLMFKYRRSLLRHVHFVILKRWVWLDALVLGRVHSLLPCYASLNQLAQYGLMALMSPPLVWMTWGTVYQSYHRYRLLY